MINKLITNFYANVYFSYWYVILHKWHKYKMFFIRKNYKIRLINIIIKSDKDSTYFD